MSRVRDTRMGLSGQDPKYLAPSATRCLGGPGRTGGAHPNRSRTQPRDIPRETQQPRRAGCGIRQGASTWVERQQAKTLGTGELRRTLEVLP